MISESWGYIAAVLNILGTITYLVAIFKGKARPNRVTWFISSIAPLVAFVSMMSQGVSLAQSIVTLSAGISPLMIFITTFLVRHPAWKIRTFDLTCGALALIGIILWWLTGKGNLAIIFSILADALGFLPTIVKSFKYPKTESPWTFMIGALADALSLLTVSVWNFEHTAFLVYLVTANTLVSVFICTKVGASKEKITR
jgi:hypothetical protein